jgi:putative FmdB family regulatory protein
MPTYEYRCERCDHSVEVVQSFTDAPLTTCESCGGQLRKVYAPVGIVFKGSGFYKTDSRTSSTSSKASASSGTEGAGASSDKPEKKKETEKKDGAAAASTPSKPNASGSGTSTPAATSGSSSTRD